MIALQYHLQILDRAIPGLRQMMIRSLPLMDKTVTGLLSLVQCSNSCYNDGAISTRCFRALFQPACLMQRGRVHYPLRSATHARLQP
jgi:hypothetical protein